MIVFKLAAVFEPGVLMGELKLLSNTTSRLWVGKKVNMSPVITTGQEDGMQALV